MLPAVLMVAAVAVGFMEVGKDNNRSRPRGRRDILAYRFVGAWQYDPLARIDYPVQ
jgi:hypothetical protein